MPPTDTPAMAVSPARLLGGVVLLALVVAVALLLAWRRARIAGRRVDEPLRRLHGFHIFGPEDDDEPAPRVHAPVLTGRPVPGRRTAVPPPPSAPVVPAARPSPAPATLRPAATAVPAVLAETIRWNVPAPAPAPAAAATATATALAPAPAVPRTLPEEPAAVELAPPPRPARRRSRPAARQEDPQPKPEPDPHAGKGHVTLEGTAAPLPGPPPRPRPRNLPADPAEMGHILLVEDDETIAGMYAMLLRTKGYTTRHARDGMEGISMVREELPALILLDMMMPRMDGLQFLQALRGWPRTADLPVVILSNVSDRHLVDRAMELGCIEYLVKAQTRPQVLIGALPHWLRGNRALTTLQ